MSNYAKIPESLLGTLTRKEYVFIIKRLMGVVNRNVRSRRANIDIKGFGTLRSHGRTKAGQDYDKRTKSKKRWQKTKKKQEWEPKKLLF